MQDANTLERIVCHTDKPAALTKAAHAGLNRTTWPTCIKTFPHPNHLPLPKYSRCHTKQVTAWLHSVPGPAHASGNKAALTREIYHVILTEFRKLRLHWEELWPRYEDVGEAVSIFAYNLGFRRNRPPRSSHSYVQKAEYWAVIWGGFLMTITGLMLWVHNPVLAWLPIIFLQLASTVHFYEVVLAALAILIWHFYSVIFDPEAYPTNPAWLTGHSARRRPGN